MRTILADPMLRLMSLIPSSALALNSVRDAMRMSNDEAGRITMWAADNLPEPVGMRGQELRATLYWHGVQAVTDRAMLSGADVRDLLAAAKSWRRPKFPIGGDDALAIGLKGEEIGYALTRVARVWVDSDFMMEREELLPLLVKQQN